LAKSNLASALPNAVLVGYIEDLIKLQDATSVLPRITIPPLAFSLALVVGLLDCCVSPSPSHAKKHPEQKTIFSSPDADGDVVPQFVGKNGQPLSTGRALKTPGLSEIRQLPSLTKQQREEIAQIQTELNLRLSSLREHISSLEARLDVMKGHPDEHIELRFPGARTEVLPTAKELKTKITALKIEIAVKQKEAAEKAFKSLTETQLEEYRAMRHGELLIDGTAPEQTNKTKSEKQKSSFGRALKNFFHSSH
jgi:hypothetical protein